MKTVTVNLETLGYGFYFMKGRYCAMGQLLHDEGVKDNNAVMFEQADARFGSKNRIAVTTASDALVHAVTCKRRGCACRVQTVADDILKLRKALAAINYKLRVLGYDKTRARRAA